MFNYVKKVIIYYSWLGVSKLDALFSCGNLLRERQQSKMVEKSFNRFIRKARLSKQILSKF